ncbi:MAG TPA: putative lipid II flippase FtsW [Kineosporiaceae bacterium]|nr:putative lipid II flippase FtsW [Kineosporiaceae bacterium]
MAARTGPVTGGAAPVGAVPPRADAPRTAWAARLQSPLAAYYLVLGSTVALVGLGLVMVLSSSSVESLRTQHSSYTIFTKQATFAAIGLPLALVAAWLPTRAWKALAWPLLLVGVLSLLLVLVAGTRVQGNQNWIVVGGITLQPSEAAKLALVVWVAAVLERKRPLFAQAVHAVVPVVPVAFLLLGLVVAGHDLGTTLVLLGLVGALMFTAGVPLRVFAVMGTVAGLAVLLLVVGSSNRMARIAVWSGSGATDPQGANWQPLHALWALASGGWWGLGLGESRQKWFWLPEAHNDFIFAIIGEELGLVGTLAVLALFALLAIGLLRLVLAAEDVFIKIATGGVLAWVLGQALINIGAVVGLLPVIGVPLPLVSSGGSALVTTLIALGMVLGFARRVPGAAEALASRPSVVRRSLAVLPGRRNGGVG